MLKKYLNKKNNLVGGYTIIETMIALSIFLIVIIIGVGSLLNASLVNKKSQDTRSIMDSLNFAMEDMSRNIRIGYDYQCLVEGGEYNDNSALGTPTSCLSGFGVAFESSEGRSNDNTDQWLYYVSGGKLIKSTSGIGGEIQMTPDEVEITNPNYNFSVVGAERFSGTMDKQQPLVIIRLSGNITKRAVSYTHLTLPTTERV